MADEIDYWLKEDNRHRFRCRHLSCCDCYSIRIDDAGPEAVAAGVGFGAEICPDGRRRAEDDGTPKVRPEVEV